MIVVKRTTVTYFFFFFMFIFCISWAQSRHEKYLFGIRYSDSCKALACGEKNKARERRHFRSWTMSNLMFPIWSSIVIFPQEPTKNKGVMTFFFQLFLELSKLFNLSKCSIMFILLYVILYICVRNDILSLFRQV